MSMQSVREWCTRNGKNVGVGAGALFLLVSTGCTVTTVDNGVPLAGQLVIDWTVEGGKDPALCAVGGASDIDITLNTDSGAFFH
ncbi:MAG TPA: hypothetical protein VGL13_06595, partial [Polyangiaceae bacterium]